MPGFDEMQFVSHCYTVVSYQAIFRHSVYKQSAVYLSSERLFFFLLLLLFFFLFLFFFFFCFFFVFFFFFDKIREFGSPTNCYIE